MFLVDRDAYIGGSSAALSSDDSDESEQRQQSCIASVCKHPIVFRCPRLGGRGKMILDISDGQHAWQTKCYIGSRTIPQWSCQINRGSRMEPRGETRGLRLQTV